jgi:hypothetical protein
VNISKSTTCEPLKGHEVIKAYIEEQSHDDGDFKVEGE